MSRLNIVREIKQKHLKNGTEHDKELKWDNRFYLGKLPEYDAYKDSNFLSIRMLREQIKNADGAKKRTQLKSTREKKNITPTSGLDGGEINNIVPRVMPLDDDDDEYYKEEMNIVQSIWEELGVNEDYRLIFESVARQLRGAQRKEFFDFEIGSLKRFSDNLIKVSREIQNREKSILLMQKLDDAAISENNPNLIEKIITDVMQCIKNLRIYSINIVNHFAKIREICSYYVMSGKYNLDKVSKSYLFDRNYLVKMKFDLDFLKNSSLGKYFNFSEEADPFFLSLADDVKLEDENNKKYSVGINEDMMKSIKQCQFIIMQDLIFYQIQCSKLIRMQSPSGTSRSKSPKWKFNYPLAKDHNKQKSCVGFYNLSVTKNNPKYNSLFFNKNAFDNKIKIEIKNKDTADVTSKVGNSDTSKENKTQQNLMTFKNIKLEQVKNTNRSKEKEDTGHHHWEINENINPITEIADTSSKGKSTEHERKDIEKLKENLVSKPANNDNEHSHKSEHEHTMKKDNECQEKKDKHNKKETDDDNYNFNDVNDEYIDEIINEEKKVENNEKSSKNAGEFHESQKEKKENPVEKPKTAICESNVNTHEEEHKSRENEKIHTETEESKKVKPDEEHNMQSQKQVDPNKRNEESLSPPQDKDQHNQVSESVKGVASMELEGDNAKSEMKISQSEIQETFQVSFFTGDLLEFATQYSKYYSQITNDQLITLNPPKESSSFSNGLNPKLLICYQKTNAESTLIGICSLSYDSLHDLGRRLTINSITSIYCDFEKIFTLFIDFIKENLLFDEILIDLHYEHREGGFCINPKIRDFFKDKVQFRWLKLENTASCERYQKMSLRIKEEQEKVSTVKEGGLRVRTCAVISVVDSATIGEGSSQENVDQLSIFTALAAVYQLKESSFSLKSDNEKEANLNLNLNSTQLKTLLGKSLSSTAGEKDVIAQFLSENHIDKTSISKMNGENNNDYWSSVYTLFTQFPNSISVLNEVDGIPYYYNRIKGPFETLYEKSTDQTFFLVPTSNQINSILIAQLTPTMKEYLLLNNRNIYKNFTDIYQKIEQNENTVQDRANQILWLPSFSSEKHIEAHNPNVLQDIQITKNDTNYLISFTEEYSTVDYRYDEAIGTSFKMKVNPSSDVVITDTFLFAIINVDILTEMNIPAVFMEVITPDKWKKHSPS